MSENAAEFQEKASRIRDLMRARGWDRLALSAPDSLAWAACGARPYVNLLGPAGVFTLLYGPRDVLALTNRIEAPRLRDEELAGLPVEITAHDWPEWNASREAIVARLAAPGRLASDLPLAGAEPAGAEFKALRYSLTEWEVRRARDLSKEAASVIEELAAAVAPGESEEAIVADMRARLGRRGILAPVALIAADGRAFQYRHPLPTAKKLERYCLLAVSALRCGLLISLSRLVHFGDPPAELLAKAAACAAVDAAFISATTVGAAVKDVFEVGLGAYAAQGYPDEWQLHHQGGAAGYTSREFLGWSGSTERVRESQLFAWNPSIAGVKSEDTILATARGPEVLTRTGRWPEIETDLGIPRPGILIR